MKKHILLFVIAFSIPFLSLSQNLIKLSGIVTDAHTGEGIVNADIFIEDEETGTITNSNGEYVLYLSKGEYDVVFSLKGYEKHTEKIVLEECMIQLVELNHKNNIGSRKSILAGWSVFNKNNTEKLTMADEK